MREGLLLGRSLLPVLAVGRKHGLDEAHLRRVGIDAARLGALDTMVPSSRVFALIEAVLPLVDVEAFAIEVATATTASDVGVLGLAMRAAPTGRLALQLLIRYQRIVNTVAGFHVLEERGEVTLAEDRCGPEGTGRLVAAELTAMTNIHWGRMLLGREFTPLRVALPRRAAFPAYRAWAGCAVSGGAARASISFSAALLDHAVPTADHELWHFFGELLRQQAGAAPESPLVHEVRRELMAVLCEGAPSLAQVARRLGEAPRTLQRRLAAEGLRYTAVLDDLRHELAVAHLGRGELAIAEIAFALGFDEVASLHRAFRRWEGTTPAVFRAARTLS